MEYSVIKEKFQQISAATPLMVRSPGRVNLIGEHTDYNQGFVLPAAINKEIVFALAKNNTQKCNLYAHDINGHFSFSLDKVKTSPKGWPNYLMGVVDQLQNAGYDVQGFDCVFGGDIPLGAGMSSSAALECGLAAGLNCLFDFGIEKIQLVKLSQKAENEFVGVQCGIMDQFASTFGKKNHVIKLDCRSLDYEFFPLEITGYKIVLINTNVGHSLASSEYNVRRKQCEEGVAIAQKHAPSVTSLRNVTLPMLEQYKSEMEPVIFQRCKYIVEENQRVEDACKALLQGNLSEFGEKMYASHEGLSKMYEVSCQELDFLVDQSRKYDAVIGARMMGGGFGGCTINLVKEDGLEKFTTEVTKAYQKAMHKDPQVYIGDIVDGTTIL